MMMVKISLLRQRFGAIMLLVVLATASYFNLLKVAHNSGQGVFKTDGRYDTEQMQKMIEYQQRRIEYQQRKTLSSSSKKTTRKPRTELTRRFILGPNACLGKDPLTRMVLKANMTVTNELCHQIPLWETVQRLHGSKPIIRGLETCESYRSKVRYYNLTHPKPRIAGLVNTGTNYLARLLEANFGPSQEGGRKERLYPYDVPWGKHADLIHRINQTYPAARWWDADRPKSVLPIVIVKDPYRWMQGICKKPYHLHWKHNKTTCSELLDRETGQPITVESRYPGLEHRGFNAIAPQVYPSLADLWSIWYLKYWNADFPRLFVRFEDLLFYPDQVITAIANCIGTPLLHDSVQIHLPNAKSHGKARDLISAWDWYGNDPPTTRGFYPSGKDLEYAQKALNATLMDIFAYEHPANATDELEWIPQTME